MADKVENTIKANLAERIMDRIVVIFGTASAVCLFALMALIFTDVFCRYLFNPPILGSTELVEFIMAVTVSLALAYGQYLKRHVFVEVFYQKIRGRAKPVVDIAISGVMFFVYMLISVTAFQQSEYLMNAGMTSGVLLIPAWPFRLILSIGAAVFCLAIARDVISYIKILIYRKSDMDQQKEKELDEIDMSW